jgi:DNA topoisomerase 2-associated protein PAT1
VVRKDPLTRRQVLAALESLYDLALNIEQLRRNLPVEEDEEAIFAWCVLAWVMASALVIGTECINRQDEYDILIEEIWVGLQVLVPLETRSASALDL